MDQEKIIYYITGNITDEEEKVKIRDWINENETNREYFIQLKNTYALSKKSIGLTDVESEYLKFLDKTQIRTKRYLIEFIKYAAVFIIAAGLTWFVKERGSDNIVEGQINEVVCPPGQISEVILSDGTHVWLNAESRISYPSLFDSKQRSIRLDGEAFFDVTKVKGASFLVKTNDVDIKVLGTSFNVNSYGCNQFVETTLVEGKVVLQDKTGKSITEMIPGQLARYNIQSSKVNLSSVDTRFYSSWKEGKITFFNEPLEAIVLKLERWYNVSFTFSNDEIKTFRFSGTILKHKPLEQVLKIIKLSSPINFNIIVNSEEKNEIILTKRLPMDKD